MNTNIIFTIVFAIACAATFIASFVIARKDLKNYYKDNKKAIPLPVFCALFGAAAVICGIWCILNWPAMNGWCGSSPGASPTGSGYAGSQPAPLALLNAPSALPGYNIVGFDTSNPTEGCGASSYPPFCATPKSVWDTFIPNNKFGVIRLPIQPARIMGNIPSSATDTPQWCGAFTNGTTCPYNYTDDDTGNYLLQLKTFLTTYPDQFFILDVHNNSGHLNNPYNQQGTTTISFNSTNFVNFWKVLSKKVNDYLDDPELSSRVIFELYNEPVNGSFTNETYATAQCEIVTYIRNQGYPNIVLVTTWGNYSGLHTWGPKSSGGDDSLQQLVDTLKTTFGPDVGAVNQGILIVYHQYCDFDWSGTQIGCSESSFNSSLWNTWISDSLEAIKGTGLAFCQTEGNVMAGGEACDSISDGSLYKDFLSDTTTGFGSQLKFFTLWQTNQYGADTGDPSSAISTTAGASVSDNFTMNTDSYGCIYTDATPSGWVTSDGKSALNGQTVPTLKW
jgi:hypothetical protein